jgi:phosphatidylglycerol:prolipoprotein diacylglycerol transferase
MRSPFPIYLAFWTSAAAIGFVLGTRVLLARRACSASTLFALGLAWGGLILGARWQFRLEELPVLEALAIPPRDLLTPGMRIPLGLVTGAVLAGLWCAVSGAPWRETGDALAVAGATTIALGRWGCFMAGCCSGTVCGAWWRPICVRYPRGTEAYNYQVGAHLIGLGDPMSLPVHPLPLYFSAGACLILLVCWILLRRGAAPGTLLAVFCIARPTTKVLLEPLRAVQPYRQLDLMLWVPVVVLAVTCCWIAYEVVARRKRTVGTLVPSSEPGRAEPGVGVG